MHPGVQVTLRPAGESDFEFAFEAKRHALGPYVAARWGWDEALQRAIHRDHWTSRPWSIVVAAQESIGTVSIETNEDHIRFGEFYLLPDYQRQGTGTSILKQVLELADRTRLPIKLEHLKWNPVGSLYRRHDFIVVAETDTHDFMVREPRAI